MKQVFLEHYLASTLDIPLQPSHRRSDNGFIVRGSLNVYRHPLRLHLIDAKHLLINFVMFLKEELLVLVDISYKTMTKEKHKALIDEVKVEKSPRFLTR